MTGDRELEGLFHEVSSGERVVFFGDRILVIKHPTLSILYHSDCIYEHHKNLCLQKGIMLEEEWKKHLKETDIWTDKQEDELNDTIVKLATIDDHLKDPAYQSVFSTLKHKQSQLIQTYVRVSSYRHALMHVCAEAIAEDQKQDWLLSTCVWQNGQPLWTSPELVGEEEDDDLVQFCTMTLRFIFTKFDHVQLRKIARSGFFRVRWHAAKKVGGGFFQTQPCDWTPPQSSLLAWANFYDQVYEDPMRPDDSVIDDDLELDRWWDQRQSELDKERHEYMHKKGQPSKGRSAFEHQDVIVFGENIEKHRREITETSKKLKLKMGGRQQVATTDQELTKQGFKQRDGQS